MRRRSGWNAAVGIAAMAVFAFLLLPSVMMVPIAFSSSSQIVFPPPGYSLHLFQQLARDGWTGTMMLSLRVAAIATGVSVLLGVPAAYGLVRGRFPGRRVVAVLMLSPMMVPTVVLALALYVFYLQLGIESGTVRLVLAHCLVTLPFVILSAGNGLKDVDPALETAATVMGAGRITVFWRVTIPLMVPSIVAGALFAFLTSFDEFMISYFVAQAGEPTLPVRMFASIQFEVSPILATISTILFALSVLICISVAAVQRRSAAN